MYSSRSSRSSSRAVRTGVVGRLIPCPEAREGAKHARATAKERQSRKRGAVMGPSVLWVKVRCEAKSTSRFASPLDRLHPTILGVVPWPHCLWSPPDLPPNSPHWRHNRGKARRRPPFWVQPLDLNEEVPPRGPTRRRPARGLCWSFSPDGSGWLAPSRGDIPVSPSLEPEWSHPTSRSSLVRTRNS
jgi:hypothetical protein